MEYSSSEQHDLELPPSADTPHAAEQASIDIEQADSQLPAKYQVYVANDKTANESDSSSDDNLPAVNQEVVQRSYQTDEQKFQQAPKLSAFDFEADARAQQPLAGFKEQSNVSEEVPERQLVKSQQNAAPSFKRSTYGYSIAPAQMEAVRPVPQQLGQLSERPSMSLDRLREENEKRARLLREQAQQRMLEIQQLEEKDKAELIAKQQAKRLQIQFNREKERQKLRLAKQKHDELMHMLKKEQLPECTRENLQKPNFFAELHEKHFPKPKNPQAVAREKNEVLYYGPVVQQQRDATQMEQKYGFKEPRQQRRAETKIPRFGALKSSSPTVQPSPAKRQTPVVIEDDYGADAVYEQTNSPFISSNNIQ